MPCPPEIRDALSGPWPSIATPFTRDDQIDFDTLRSYLDFLIEQSRARAVVLTWGDSLYSLLTDDEIAEVTKVVVQHVGGRAFVVAADNQWPTVKGVAFARYCVEVGADMLMVLPPDWARSATVDSLVDHYGAIAEHIPVMLVTGYLMHRPIPFGLQLVTRLCREVEGVMALKDDVGGELIRRVCLVAHEHWALCGGGLKQNHMNMVPYGADGYLSTYMSCKPEIAWRYWDAVQSGQLEVARDIIRDYDFPLFEILRRCEGGSDAGIHGMCELFGVMNRYRRSPYHSLTDPQMEQLADELSRVGIL